jgi:hypothetical protein
MMALDPGTGAQQSPEGEDARAVLRRVGVGLLLLALLGVGWSVYEAIATRGRLYDINVWAFLAVAGVLLWRGSLTTARLVVAFSALVLGIVAASALSLLTTPLDLTWSFLRLHPLVPVGDVPGLALVDPETTQAYLRLHPLGPLGEMLGVVVLVAIAAALYLRLTAPAVLAAHEAAAGRHTTHPRRPLLWLLIGAALGLTTIVRFVILTRSNVYREAKAQLRSQLKPDLRFLVTDAHRYGSRELTARATVYNDHTYRRLEATWQGSPPQPADLQEELCTDTTYAPPPPGMGRVHITGLGEYDWVLGGKGAPTLQEGGTPVPPPLPPDAEPTPAVTANTSRPAEHLGRSDH